ncbi:NADH-quinone oxidoreductase subunit A, partial [Staphylococcus sp. GDK8D30P]|uniref:NADH-quinone oxidoreductase subunit A n=1 Tax=Staphylococcus sp. GDK8D30P TaxID=2804090 RepID=UPI001AEC3F3E
MFNYISVLILGIIIYNIIACVSLRSLIKRFGFEKNSRKDFYECGFRPQSQKPLKLSIQFLLICIFFLMYDVELVFVFPYVSGLFFAGFFDFIIFNFFFNLFFF